jgi:hypothetical protein
MKTYNQLLEPLPTKQLRFPTPKRNLKRRTKNPFRQTNRDTPSIQQRPRPHHQKQNKRCRINHYRKWKSIPFQRSRITSSSCTSCRTLENNRIPPTRNQPNQIRKRHRQTTRILRHHFTNKRNVFHPIRKPKQTNRFRNKSITQKLHRPQRQPKTSRSSLRSH